MIELLNEGYNRRELCRELGIHHSTLYAWMDSVDFLREGIEGLEERAADRRRYRRWLNHPFRGKRPPRRFRKDGPFPKPHGAGIKGIPSYRVPTAPPRA